MRAKCIFGLYVWLIDTIRRYDGISFEELRNRWALNPMSDDLALSHTTFMRHKQDIEDIFGIRLQCMRKKDKYVYYIDNENILDSINIQNWMLSSLSTGAIISQSLDQHENILMENIPVITPYLDTIISSLRERHCLRIKYQRYDRDEKESVIEPYCLKLFRMRWYMLAKVHAPSHMSRLCLYSFDRLKKIQATDETYEIGPGFKPAEYFKDYYGVLTPDSISLENIIIRAYGTEASYMRDLPVHHSQTEICRTDKYSDFSLRLRPARDFVSYLLGRGSRLMAMSPKWLAEEIMRSHYQAASLYRKQLMVAESPTPTEI